MFGRKKVKKLSKKELKLIAKAEKKLARKKPKKLTPQEQKALDKQQEILQLNEETSMVDNEVLQVLEEKDSTSEPTFEDFVPEEEEKELGSEIFETIPQKQEDPIKMELDEDEEETETSNEEKKDLSVFFEGDAKKKEKLKKSKKKPKRKSRRKKKKERELQDVKDRKIFRYDNKKYTQVEDFVRYLNDHYLDIDDIAVEILDDENFYGWISKRSGTFEESLKKFKEIKEKIEK